MSPAGDRDLPVGLTDLMPHSDSIEQGSDETESVSGASSSVAA